MRRTTVLLEEEDWIGLKQKAQRQGRTPSEMIRQGVAANIAGDDRDDRPSVVGLGASGRADVSRRPEEHLGKD